MKGLLIKDSLPLKKYFPFPIILYIFLLSNEFNPYYVYYLPLPDEAYITNTVLFFTFVCMVITWFSLFESISSNWNTFFLTSPISRKTIVLSKYVYTLSTVMLFSLILILGLCSVTLSYSYSTSAIIQTVTMFISLSTNAIAILLPCLFLCIKPETNYWARIYIQLLCYFCVWLFYNYQSLIEYFANNAFTTIPIMTIIALSISIFISIKVMESKSI